MDIQNISQLEDTQYSAFVCHGPTVHFNYY